MPPEETAEKYGRAKSLFKSTEGFAVAACGDVEHAP